MSSHLVTAIRQATLATHRRPVLRTAASCLPILQLGPAASVSGVARTVISSRIS